jgi:hypothetical protein
VGNTELWLAFCGPTMSPAWKSLGRDTRLKMPGVADEIWLRIDAGRVPTTAALHGKQHFGLGATDLMVQGGSALQLVLRLSLPGTPFKVSVPFCGLGL